MSRNGAGVYSLPAGSLVANGDTSDASDLNTPLSDIEADLNVARPIVAGGTGATTAAAARSNLGLVIGTNVQAYDAGLQSISGLTTAADKGIYTTASDTYATFDLTAAGRTIGGVSALGTSRQLFAMDSAGTGLTWVDDEYYGVLQSAYTLTSTVSQQKLFNWSANGALTLPTGTYRFDMGLSITGMSATSGNAAIGLLGAGTATLATIRYFAYSADTGSFPAAADMFSSTSANTAAFTAQGTTATSLAACFSGVFDVTASGTIIPSVTLATAAAAAVGAGSYFRCRKMGPTATATVGPWS